MAWNLRSIRRKQKDKHKHNIIRTYPSNTTISSLKTIKHCIPRHEEQSKNIEHTSNIFLWNTIKKRNLVLSESQKLPTFGASKTPSLQPSSCHLQGSHDGFPTQVIQASLTVHGSVLSGWRQDLEGWGDMKNGMTFYTKMGETRGWRTSVQKSRAYTSSIFR